MRFASIFQSVREYRWLIVANLFLLSPIPCYELNLAEDGPDRSLAFILSASLVLLVVAQSWLTSARTTHLLLLPFYIAVAADLYVIEHYNTRLGSSMLLILLENSADMHEYTQSHGRDLAFTVAAFVVGYCLLIRKLGGVQLRVPRAIRLGSLLAFAVLYVVVSKVVGSPMHALGHDRSSPFGVVSQMYVASVVYRDAGVRAEKSKNFLFGAKHTQTTDVPETYVLVVGESSRPDHWGIYGYERDTTPRITALSNVHLFENVLSQAALTKASVPLILTRGRIDDATVGEHEKSVVSALHEAGYETRWLSTQQRDPFTGAINRYSSEADSQRFFERRHDATLVTALHDVLAESTSPRLFVVVHTNGSHYEYASRYPSSFSVFGAHNTRASAHDSMVDAYDNSVLYGDFVLSRLIGELAQRRGIKALLYISDHGENLEDDSRKLYGHNMNNEYDLPIPMFMWHSPEFAARWPEKVAAVAANTKLPINTRAVFHTVLDMASVSVNDPMTPKLSVLSSALVPQKRMVAHEPAAIDFDAWVAARGKFRMRLARATK